MDTRSGLWWCLPLALALGWPAAAQQHAAREPQLEEITVTARKVAESQQTTPIAITAITESALDRSFVTDLRDLAGLAPNVHLEETAGFGTASAFGIRGVHVSDPESTFDPAVGLVVDGVYFGRTAGGIIDLFDVRQIEILRGPQGTLFGKNTTGGAINVTYKRPGTAPLLEGQLRVGRFDRVDARLAAEGSVVPERLAVRVSLLRDRDDGFVRDLETGRTRKGRDVNGARLVAVWTPVASLSNETTVEWLRDRTGASSPQNVSLPGQGWSFCEAFGACDDGSMDAGRYSLPERTTTDSYLVANTLTWDLGATTLVAVTGYREVDDLVYTEYDGGTVVQRRPNGAPANLFDGTRDQVYDQFSQEIRLAGAAFGGRVDYVGGLFYFRSSYALEQSLDLPLNDFTLPGPQTPFIATVRTRGHQNVESYAAFGQLNTRVSDAVRFVLGLRYTDERKIFDGIPFGAGLDATLEALFGPLAGTGVGPVEPLREDFSDLSPRVGLDWQVSPDVFAYASWSRGFKSGGFSGRAFSRFQVGPYEDETVDAYELGVKTDLLDGRVRVNAAIFYNRYTDAQLEVNQPPPLPGTPAFDEIQNAGRVSMRGAELELTAAPTDALSLSASIGYLDARYDEFCSAIPRRPVASGGPGPGTPCGPTLNGVTPTDNTDLLYRRSPETTARVAASHAWAVRALGTLRASADYTYTDRMALTLTNARFAIRPATRFVNASVAFEAASSRWSLALYGKNLSDEREVQTASELGGQSAVAWYNEPRTYGMEVRFRVE